MTKKTKKPSTKTLKEIKDNGVALKNASHSCEQVVTIENNKPWPLNNK